MKTMKWLLRREFWEHKGSMLWAPIVVAALMVCFASVSMLWATSKGNLDGTIAVHSQHGEATTVTTTHINVASMYNALPMKDKQNLMEMLSNIYLAVAAPLFLVLAAVAFFYCLAALHDERRDRSILFWKSLPVSDTQTVLSKVLTASVVAPLLTIAISTLVTVVMLLIVGLAAAFHGINIFVPVLSNPDFYLMPLQTLALLPVYILWALPTIGWLMMVSAWARSKVFLWAVGTPVLTMIIIKWVDYLMNLNIPLEWVGNNIIARGLTGLIPGIWLPLSKVNADLLIKQTSDTVAMSGVVNQSWLTLASPGVWIGAAVGCAMLYAAIRLRRWKDEG